MGMSLASPDEDVGIKDERRQALFLRFEQLSCKERECSVCDAAPEGDPDPGNGQNLVVWALFAAGADTKSVYKFGDRARIHAPLKGPHEVAKTLLAVGADLNGQTSGEKVVKWESRRGEHEVVQLLLDAGADTRDSFAGVGQPCNSHWKTFKTMWPTHSTPEEH